MQLSCRKTYADKPSQRLGVALHSERRRLLPFRFQGNALMGSAAFHAPTDSQWAQIRRARRPVLTERLRDHTLAVLQISYS